MYTHVWLVPVIFFSPTHPISKGIWKMQPASSMSFFCQPMYPPIEIWHHLGYLCQVSGGYIPHDSIENTQNDDDISRMIPRKNESNQNHQVIRKVIGSRRPKVGGYQQAVGKKNPPSPKKMVTKNAPRITNWSPGCRNKSGPSKAIFRIRNSCY